jgi:hypothetical protein
MEEWQKNFFDGVEALFDELAYQVELFVNDVFDSLDEVTEIVEQTLQENQCFQEFQDLFDLRPPVYPDTEEGQADSDTFVSYSYPVEPSIDLLPACQGCVHYHGQVYGGNLLVCGMHPLGRGEDPSCPDWENYKVDDLN